MVLGDHSGNTNVLSSRIYCGGSGRQITNKETLNLILGSANCHEVLKAEPGPTGT